MHISEKTLIIGGDGFIGNALVESFNDGNQKIISTTNKLEKIKANAIYLNLADIEKKWNIPNNIDSAVICAGITKLEFCEKNEEYSHFINVKQMAKLIKLLLQRNIFILYLSSNQVFNGEMSNTLSNAKYSPINNYGKQKVEIEKYIGNSSGKWGILRLSKVLDESFVLFHEWINKLKTEKTITVFDDLYIAPLHIGNVIAVIKSIVQKKQNGIFQFSAKKDISYYEIMKNMCDKYGYSKNLIKRENYRNKIDFNLPRFSTLDSEIVNKLFGFKRPDTEETIDKIFSNII